MSLCMCLYAYLCLSACICLHVYLHAFLCLHACLRLHVYLCVFVSAYVCPTRSAAATHELALLPTRISQWHVVGPPGCAQPLSDSAELKP